MGHERLVHVAPLGIRSDAVSSLSLLFIHGSQHHSGFWSGMQAHFAAKGYESYALAMSSSRWASVASLVQQLREATTSLKKESLVLVGHSQGALIVQSYLATGGTGRGAILMAPVPLSARLFLQHCRSLLAKISSTQLAASFITLNSKHAIAPDMATMKRHFFLESTHWTTRIDSGVTIEEYYRHQITSCDTAAGAAWCRGTACDIRVPTLVLAGDRDALVDIEVASGLAAAIPSAMLVVIQDQAHAFADPGWENTVCDPIEAFLSQLTAAKSHVCR